MKDFRSSFSDASVPGTAWDRTGEEAPPHGQQAEPAVHEVPRQSLGTRIVHGVAQRGDPTSLNDVVQKPQRGDPMSAQGGAT